MTSKSHKPRFTLTNGLVLLAFLTLSALAACGEAPTKTEDRAGAVEPQRAPAAPTTRLLAAAEPFEKLTETSFVEPFAVLDATVAEAHGAGAAIRDLLPAAMQSELDARLADIAAQRAKRDRAGLALASIEAYRLIVSAVPSNPSVPVEVSLLDYAGFRYQADVKASPIRWDDMAKAMTFAREQWARVSPRVADAPLTAAFDKRLADMDSAVRDRSAPKAETAAAAALDSVDLLEQHFNKN